VDAPGDSSLSQGSRSGRAHRVVTTSRKGSTVHSAWKRRHDLAEDACPECQGSTYVPGPMYEERMVDKCPKCRGTGKDATKQAA
jgi:Zn-finger nucleic acid-binding protein